MQGSITQRAHDAVTTFLSGEPQYEVSNVAPHRRPPDGTGERPPLRDHARRQRSSVAGVTMKARQRTRGRARLATENNTRSTAVIAGRGSVRVRIADDIVRHPATLPAASPVDNAVGRA